MEMFVLSVRPVISPMVLESDIYAGELIQLFCTVSRGDLPISSTWLLNGERLPMTSSKRTMTQVGPRTLLLTIHSVTAWDSGNYTCLSENPAGVTEFTVPLLVHGINTWFSYAWVLCKSHLCSVNISLFSLKAYYSFIHLIISSSYCIYFPLFPSTMFNLFHSSH